jgi:hypothetical protein
MEPKANAYPWAGRGQQFANWTNLTQQAAVILKVLGSGVHGRDAR